MARILICDDEEILCRSLARALRSSGHEVVTGDGPGGLARIGGEPFDLVLTDLRMPDVSGFQIIAAVMERIPQTLVIAMSGCAEVQDAVRAMHAGAVDFLVKPFELDALEESVRVALGPAPCTPEAATTDPLVWRDRHAPWLLGEDPAMHPVLELLSQAADTRCSAMIVGESGSGKDLAARALHAGSTRRDGPFVVAPCAMLVPETAESELFGEVSRGVANPGQRGMLAQADGGTVLLDEVGNLSPALQSKLLRLIEEGELYAVGARAPEKIDIRLLATSTRRLDGEVSAGRFRADLFWRLNVVSIELPPLRKRPSDIPRLAQAFLARANRRHDRRVRGIEQRAMTALTSYAWPGNVRELENLVERLVIVRGTGMLGLADLPPVVGTPRSVTPIAVPLDLPAEGADLRATLDAIEQRMIGEALERAGGNKNRAAELLGLNRTTLVEKLRRRRAGSETYE